MVNEQHSVLHEPSLQLRDHVEQLNTEFACGNYPRVMQLIERNALSSFFGSQTDHLRSMLRVLIEQGVDEHRVARTMLALLEARDGITAVSSRPIVFDSGHEVLRPLKLLGQLTEHRLNGRIRDAEMLLDVIDSTRVRTEHRTIGTSGWELMTMVQCGNTAMLAGDFTRANAYFTSARLQLLIPSLAFLTRDAYAKMAVIAALFGDPEDASLLLKQADAVPRTQSWAEPIIDTVVTIVEALIDVEDGEGALAHLESIPLHTVGEMWPLYILAMQRCAERAGQRRQFQKRLSIFERANLPRIDGEGIPGSVFQVVRAMAHLRWNNFEEAERLLQTADPLYVGVNVIATFVEIGAGRPSRAIRFAERLADHRVSGLRLVELWRYASLATAYHRLGRPEHAKEALRAILALPGGLRPEDTTVFFDELLEFAVRDVQTWPTESSRWKGRAQGEDAQLPRLTAREFEVIRQLASERTQQEIAQEMFVSVNTLKSHLKAIYKKLDVQSRKAAVLRAENEGWL